MRHFMPVAVAIAFLLALPALASDYEIGELEVEHPWARATPGGVKNGAAYLTIYNEGSNADRLVGAESPAAKRTELHISKEEGGVMKMMPLTAVEIPPGGKAALKPGGMHVMLMGLNKPLSEGQSVPLTLIFEHAGRIDVEVAVVRMGADGMQHHHGDHMDGGMDDDMKHDMEHNGDEGHHGDHHSSIGHHNHASSPIGVMGDHLMGEGEFMLGYRFMHMDMEGNRDGTRKLSPEEIVTGFSNVFFGVPGQPPTLRIVPLSMTMDMHMVSAMYAPADWVTLMAMGSYLEKEMDHVTFAGGAGTTVLGNFTVKTRGIGDSKLAAVFGLYDDGTHRIHANAGISLPTGSIDEEAQVLAPNGATPVLRVPYPMQLGSGTFDALPGFTFTTSMGKVSGGAQYGAVLRLGENSEDYSLGDEHRVSVWGGYAWTPWLTTTARINGQTIGRINGQDPQIVAPVQTADPDRQGGQRIDALVGVNLVGGKTVGLEGHRLGLEFGVPVYQSLHGPQLETDWLLTLGYTITI